MAAPREHLGRLRDRLRDLLSQLDHPSPDPAALERAVGDCERLVAGLKAGGRLRDGLSSGDRAALAAELEQTLRLNAVAMDRVQQDAGILTRGLARAREVRRGTAQSGDRAGGSCDVSG
jgi:hypothetical protein